MRPFDGRRVLLVVSGGIAAYKSAILARRLIEAGAGVEVILTASAERFIGRVTFEGITGRPVHASLWDRPMAHLDLGLEANAIVVAPATANLISRLAAGAADDLATTAVLAARAPVIVCPAMNTRMWEHPITQANVARLAGAGYEIAGPADGPLAEGESGPGRLLEPEEILPRIGRALETATGLRGRKVVATAGPTRAALDPVRFISNRSSGRMGYALAEAAWRRGGDVTLISGPGRLPRPPGARCGGGRDGGGDAGRAGDRVDRRGHPLDGRRRRRFRAGPRGAVEDQEDEQDGEGVRTRAPGGDRTC